VWKEAKRLLQRMTRLGLTRVKDTLDGHTIALPANLTMVGDSCRGVLTQAASQLGYVVSWVDEENRSHELYVPYQILPGDRVPALMGGRSNTFNSTGYQTTLTIHGRRKTEQLSTLESWVYGHKQRHLTSW
jgi:hypothetical protein